VDVLRLSGEGVERRGPDDSTGCSTARASPSTALGRVLLAFSPPGSARHLAEGGVPGSGERWPAISAPFLK
jgi:hypothetical protein